jgi:hypothetical protein
MHIMTNIGGVITSLKQVSSEVFVIKIMNSSEKRQKTEKKDNTYPIFAFKKKGIYILKNCREGDIVMISCIIREDNEKIFLEASSVGVLGTSMPVDRSVPP